MERERPVLCVDIAIYGKTKILLIRRAHAPDTGKLALPGGHFEMSDTSVVCAAARELTEETGFGVPSYTLKFLTFLDAPNRDPRARVISAVFILYIPDMLLDQFPFHAGSDAKEIVIRDIWSIKPEEMALDHYRVIEMLKTRQ